MLNVAVVNSLPESASYETTTGSTLYIAKDGANGLKFAFTNQGNTALAYTKTEADITTMIGDAIGADGALIPVVVADIGARDDLGATMDRNGFVLVSDASADATVESGAAMYFFNDAAAEGSEWTKIYEYEGMDVQIPNLSTLLKLTEDGNGNLLYDGELVTQVTNSVVEW